MLVLGSSGGETLGPRVRDRWGTSDPSGTSLGGHLPRGGPLALRHRLDYYIKNLYFVYSKVLYCQGIPKQTKDILCGLYDPGLTKPDTLLMAIKEKQLPIPTLQQLYNFLSSYRKRKFGCPSISIGSLQGRKLGVCGGCLAPWRL